MTDQQFHHEFIYQMTLKEAEKLLDLGVIDDLQYQSFKKGLLKKYQPIISRLSR